MSNEIDPLQIAARISFLIGGGRGDSCKEAARNLGVSEAALRISVDGPTPHPVLEVVVAVVRRFRVDPSWLVFGEYDPTPDQAAGAAHKKSELSRMLAKHFTPGGTPLVPSPRAERDR